MRTITLKVNITRKTGGGVDKGGNTMRRKGD